MDPAAAPAHDNANERSACAFCRLFADAGIDSLPRFICKFAPSSLLDLDAAKTVSDLEEGRKETGTLMLLDYGVNPVHCPVRNVMGHRTKTVCFYFKEDGSIVVIFYFVKWCKPLCGQEALVQEMKSALFKEVERMLLNERDAPYMYTIPPEKSNKFLNDLIGFILN